MIDRWLHRLGKATSGSSTENRAVFEQLSRAWQEALNRRARRLAYLRRLQGARWRADFAQLQDRASELKAQ